MQCFREYRQKGLERLRFSSHFLFFFVDKS